MWFFETSVSGRKYKNRCWVGITETWYTFSQPLERTSSWSVGLLTHVTKPMEKAWCVCVFFCPIVAVNFGCAYDFFFFGKSNLSLSLNRIIYLILTHFLVENVWAYLLIIWLIFIYMVKSWLFLFLSFTNEIYEYLQ